MRRRIAPKFRRLATATILAVGLAACGGANVADTTAAPTTTQATTTTQAATTTAAPTTTTQTATTTTVDAVTEAGAYYLEIVAPSNCTVNAIAAAEDGFSDSDGFLHEEDWDQMQAELPPLYLAHADEELKFIDALAAYDWPVIVAADVETLTGELSVMVDYWQGLAASSSFDAWAGYVDNTTLEAPAQIRAKLGLPASPGIGPVC